MATPERLEPEDRGDEFEVLGSSGDILDEITAAIGRKALAGGKDASLRLAIRLQPTLWNPEKGQYIGWRGVSHMITVRDQAAAERFRGMLEELFATLRDVGMDAVEGALKAAREQKQQA